MTAQSIRRDSERSALDVIRHGLSLTPEFRKGQIGRAHV